MFAYCNNNPINRVEIAGYFSVKCWDDASDYSLGFDDIMGIAGGGAILAFGAKIISDIIAQPQPITLPSSKTKINAAATAASIAATVAATQTVADTENNAVYYGAHIYGGSDWTITTNPMSLEEAVVWAISMRDGLLAIPGTDIYYGKSACWGGYTKYAHDAWTIGMILGNPFLEPNPKSHEKLHLHLEGHNFGRYKHFHIWYES